MIRALIRKALTLPIGGFPPFQIDGALIDAPGSQGAQASRDAFALINGGGYNFQSSAAATITLTSLQSLFEKLTNGGAVTVTLDSAYNIVRNVIGPFLGQVFNFKIFSSGAGTVATPTLSDTAVTLSGTTSIVAGNVRQYQVQITQLSTTSGAALTAGTTFTSITQVGTTNNFTLALGTNAISPTVGQAILLNVTAGTAGTTLPSGWYPINKVTSATSFVLALPPGTVWTATAATLPGTTTIPASAFTPGLPGLYSPLVTITAMEAYAAVV